MWALSSFLSLSSVSSSLSPSRSFSRNLIQEQVQAYKTLLGTDSLTADGLLSLLKFHDEDTVCGEGPCQRHLQNFIGDTKQMEWTRLEQIIQELYGDMISSDPFQPQEVHLSLTGDLTQMKVMWVTMENLIEPFVEYTSNMNEWIAESTYTAYATNYTYEVPQNW
jgi:hypothetical protein